ncbi:MAG: hypothetical protein JFR41_01395 [Muribaculaceae bacterium]|nr:hypothetical protein [Muribaculaceae bacterium]
MKKIFLFNLLIILLASCGDGNQNIIYKTYTAENKAYSVEIPNDFSLMQNQISGHMAFQRSSANSSDGAFITIQPTNDGFGSFDKSLNSNPKFNYTVYSESSTSKFAECTKGMWSAVQLGMIKEINGQQYLITLSAQVSRSSSENIIKHIYNSMVSGIPANTSELTKDSERFDGDRFKTYSNPHFSISYPNDWKNVAQPDAMSDVYLGAPDESLGFTVVRFETDATLSEIVAEAKVGAQQGGMSVTSNKNIKLNGLNCNRMVCEFNYQGIPIKTVAYSFKEGNTFYNIKFGTKKAQVDANATLINEIMNTFKVK